MKYKLLQNLPFANKGEIFEKGCWVGGGWGIDRGNDSHGSHNGTTVFNDFENALIDSVIEKKDWIEWIPEHGREKLDLYDTGRYDRDKLINEL